MKLLIAIVRSTDDGPVIEQLTAQGYQVTRMTSTGGILRQGNVTLLIGAPGEQINSVCTIIREACSPAAEGEPRATVFVLNADAFRKI